MSNPQLAKQFTVASLSSTSSPTLSTTPRAVAPTMPTGAFLADSQTFNVRVARAAGSFTGITIKFQGSIDGASATTAAALNWTDVYVTDLSTNTSSVTHTLSPSGSTTKDWVLGTLDLRNRPYWRAVITATGADAGAGDSVVVTANVS